MDYSMCVGTSWAIDMTVYRTTFVHDSQAQVISNGIGPLSEGLMIVRQRLVYPSVHHMSAHVKFPLKLLWRKLLNQ